MTEGWCAAKVRTVRGVGSRGVQSRARCGVGVHAGGSEWGQKGEYPFMRGSLSVGWGWWDAGKGDSGQVVRDLTSLEASSARVDRSDRRREANIAGIRDFLSTWQTSGSLCSPCLCLSPSAPRCHLLSLRIQIVRRRLPTGTRRLDNHQDEVRGLLRQRLLGMSSGCPGIFCGCLCLPRQTGRPWRTLPSSSTGYQITESLVNEDSLNLCGNQGQGA